MSLDNECGMGYKAVCPCSPALNKINPHTEEMKLRIAVQSKGRLNEDTMAILAEAGIITMDSEYGENVALTVLVPVDQTGSIEKKLIEGTSGRCGIEKLDRLYYGLDDGEIVLL